MHTAPSVVLPSTTSHAPTPPHGRGHQDNQHGDSSTYRYPVGGRRANRRTVRRGLLAETAQRTSSSTLPVPAAERFGANVAAHGIQRRRRQRARGRGP